MPVLTWLTREHDLKSAQNAPYRLLEETLELSAGDATTENMLIQGDNLDALKALLPYYAGQVKCIYIDPPYNTRSAFEHYDDNLPKSGDTNSRDRALNSFNHDSDHTQINPCPSLTTLAILHPCKQR